MPCHPIIWVIFSWGWIPETLWFVNWWIVNCVWPNFQRWKSKFLMGWPWMFLLSIKKYSTEKIAVKVMRLALFSLRDCIFSKYIKITKYYLHFALEKIRNTLYNDILRIAKNLMETKENIKIEAHPFYHIICNWFSWGSRKTNFCKKKIQNGRFFKMAIFQNRQFSNFFCENFMDCSLSY